MAITQNALVNERCSLERDSGDTLPEKQEGCKGWFGMLDYPRERIAMKKTNKKPRSIARRIFSTMSPEQIRKAKKVVTPAVLANLEQQLEEIGQNRPSVPERPGIRSYPSRSDVHWGPPGAPPGFHPLRIAA